MGCINKRKAAANGDGRFRFPSFLFLCAVSHNSKLTANVCGVGTGGAGMSALPTGGTGEAANSARVRARLEEMFASGQMPRDTMDFRCRSLMIHRFRFGIFHDGLVIAGHGASSQSSARRRASPHSTNLSRLTCHVSAIRRPTSWAYVRSCLVEVVVAAAAGRTVTRGAGARRRSSRSGETSCCCQCVGWGSGFGGWIFLPWCARCV